ncbi:hypothetical protein ASPZODRAFT_2111073 [Penicilliopsis zonata CBS 506.65]|uniref:non-specific serine/threonine protein kinase n=1 Tax=Penicilliopsis zonata CBS 506.65 TaxID=1073090 RepID=A0A1L9SDI6_9EURO|nr:hypothetical protein ASPZODRAFT_2111073 [Penicilliopsis zonata CBS 506.65]OJJ45147.1 hypothetical protein ASPZODRAFT_2111073 [Penicilliopsis zonata CBS 506.65]
MVFEPLGEPLWILKARFQGNVIPPDTLRLVSKMIIEGLDYLHSQCPVIHTDLKPDNVLMALREHSRLHLVAQDEIQEPLPQKGLQDRTIYLSRNYFGLQGQEIGRPVITDFGLAVRGDQRSFYHHSIQPDEYRAPEVILDAGWSYSVDIWNLGVLIWDLLEGSGPFDMAKSGMETHSVERHLARIIALIGPPPMDLLQDGKESSRYFDNKGRFKFPDLIPECRGMEDSLTSLEGQDKRMFLDFVSRMVQWRPADRSKPEELLLDPWLRQP